MRKNIGYIRTSTELQKHSLETQINMSNDYCIKAGIILNEIVSDEAISGKSTKNRDGYFKIIEMNKNKELYK